MSCPVRIDKSPEEFQPGDQHPNELDLRRIARMLGKRTRYRYVAASVIPTVSGYQVISPCCSRSISADGSTIDIALIQYHEASGSWVLFNKDHQTNKWQLHTTAPRIDTVVNCLNEDPGRVFWQ